MACWEKEDYEGVKGEYEEEGNIKFFCGGEGWGYADELGERYWE